MIRAYMAGAILPLAGVFAVTALVQSGYHADRRRPVLSWVRHTLPAGLRPAHRRVRAHAHHPYREAAGRHHQSILHNWGLVFVANFLGAFTVPVFMAIVFTYSFAAEPDKLG